MSSAGAFLLVFSSPGDSVSLDEFQDWYNNEHVPLRMNHLPFFLSGARYQNIKSPEKWAAVYEITSPEVFEKKEYTSLREKRSEREKDVVKRLGLLERGTYRVLTVEGEEGGFEPGDRTSRAIVIGEKDGVEGWKRRWVLETIEYSRIEKGVQVDAEYPKEVYLYEFRSAEEAGEGVGTYSLYRAYPRGTS